MQARRRTAGTIAVVGACLVLTAACGDDDDTTAPGETTSTTSTTAGTVEEAEWGYEGGLGPENWGGLSPDYTACVDGSAQSPIDLSGATEENIADIGFDYAESGLNLFNNGHTIEVEYDEGSSVDLGGETYDVVQFHFHAGSEHTVDGEQFPMELHIVHRTPDERLAVVGVFLEVGAENQALASVFENLPTEVSDEAAPVEGETIDLAAALPQARTYFQYEGSLTTPPCTEGVAWQVLDTPVEISQEQFDAFTAEVNGNFRPTQPLGNRELAQDTGPDQ